MHLACWRSEIRVIWDYISVGRDYFPNDSMTMNRLKNAIHSTAVSWTRSRMNDCSAKTESVARTNYPKISARCIAAAKNSKGANNSAVDSAQMGVLSSH